MVRQSPLRKRAWLVSTLAAGLVSTSLLSPASSLRADELSDLFAKLDKNSDGAISADEVAAEQKPLFDRLLRTSDANKDGKLSTEEFAAGLKAPAPSGDTIGGAPRPAAGGGLAGLIPSPKAMFERMDKNKDGKLTKDELPSQLSENFDRLDANSDGSIDLTEVEALAGMIGRGAQAAGGAAGSSMFGAIFDRQDKNSDGKLTADELPEDRRAIFEKMVERLNPEGKGELSKEQFITGMQMLAGAPMGAPIARPGTDGPGPGTTVPSTAPPMMSGPVVRALDTNSDGKLDKEEIENASKSLAILDRDQDGELSMRELSPAPPEGRPEGRPDALRPAPPADQMLKRLKAADTNGDGKLSKEEAPDRLKDNFDLVDADGDGLIDETEIKALLERFRPQ